MSKEIPDREASFEEFVRRHGGRLLQTAVLLAHDEHVGQDLLQDALEQVYRNWATRELDHPAAYVRTVMVRLIHRRRLRERFRFVHLTDQDRPIEDPTTGVTTRAVLLAGLAQLPPGRRAAVVLRHWEGYSEAETAQLMGCSIGTVKSQTHRGLLALREACALAFHPPGDGAAADQFPATDLIGGAS